MPLDDLMVICDADFVFFHSPSLLVTQGLEEHTLKYCT